jgi:hypothetical protein
MLATMLCRGKGRHRDFRTSACKDVLSRETVKLKRLKLKPVLLNGK